MEGCLSSTRRSKAYMMGDSHQPLKKQWITIQEKGLSGDHLNVVGIELHVLHYTNHNTIYCLLGLQATFYPHVLNDIANFI